MSRAEEKTDPATQARLAGRKLVASHPLFSPMMYRIFINDKGYGNQCPERGWGVVFPNGSIHLHPKRRGTPDEWARVISHLLLHLGFDHFKEEGNPDIWNTACNVVCNRFLRELKFGKQPEDMPEPGGAEWWSGKDERWLYAHFLQEGVPPLAEALSFGGLGKPTMMFGKDTYTRKENWSRLLSVGIRNAVSRAVEVAAGAENSMFLSDEDRQQKNKQSSAHLAMKWIIEHFPLLGGLASAFRLEEDAKECIRQEVSIAAISVDKRIIYINPAAGLSELECRIVIMHELLHAGLEHEARRNGRDRFLWNVACDYVINSWLIEMNIGALPSVGFLHDSTFKGKSAEEIYYILATNLRKSRKLSTLIGREGLCDMLDDGVKILVEGRDSDRFCREALARGMEYHLSVCRGSLPAGLEQDIRALMQPPVPWDVELARWFDVNFPLPEKIRTYARPSRRQGATPDIPRPRAVPISEAMREGRVFGVILDTSGSMDSTLLGKALGSIASYSYAHEVAGVRVVFCDAEAYDAGYMLPDEIAGRVRVKGRGGTILQPGVDFLMNADDFPKDAPILIITDAECDKVSVSREHAWLLPNGKRLPFTPSGPTFYVS